MASLLSIFYIPIEADLTSQVSGAKHPAPRLYTDRKLDRFCLALPGFEPGTSRLLGENTPPAPTEEPNSAVPGTDFVCKICTENLMVDLWAEMCAESEK